MPILRRSKNVIGDLTEVGRDLLVMEISTIESQTITGHKMPWFPHAVIDVLTKYADWFVVTRELKMGTILDCPDPLTRELLITLTLSEAPESDTQITNGWRTIEQIRRTAKFLVDDELMQALHKEPLTPIERSLAVRIRRNCDQLKAMVVRFRATEVWKRYFLTDAAVQNIAQARTETSSDHAWTSFRQVDDGLTRSGISRSLERAGKSEHAVLDSDAAIRLRKIWELGTDSIVAQTLVHIDGDIVTRVHQGMDQETLAYYLNIHNQGIDTAVKQWRTLFDAFTALVGGVADRIFGRST